MRKLALSFLCGIALACAIWIALLEIGKKQDEENVAEETLDFLIDEWTKERTFDERLAQVPARIELPNARPGFFPDTVKALASHIQYYYRVPKGVVLAQWALESSWGRNNLGVSNYFGHMLLAVLPYKKDSTFVVRREKVPATDTTMEFAAGKPVRFASYNDIAECFDVHGKYLTQSRRYRRAFSSKGQENFARELSRAGYALDEDYALKLIAIMRRYKL